MSSKLGIKKGDWESELGKMGVFIDRLIEAKDLSKAQQRRLTKPAARIVRDAWRTTVPILRNKGAERNMTGDQAKNWGPWQYRGGKGRWNKHVRYRVDGSISMVHMRGNLLKAIVTKAWRKSRDSFAIVLTNHNGSNPKHDGWYHNFLEKGTADRVVTIKRHANQHGPTGRAAYKVRWAGLRAMHPRKRAMTRSEQAVLSSIVNEAKRLIPEWFDDAAKMSGLK